MKTIRAPASPPVSPGLPPLRTGLLNPFFTARTIAVIGASQEAGTVGRALLDNLRGFDGRVFSIEPEARTGTGASVCARLSESAETIDLALIVTPAEAVPAAVRDCARAGIQAAIILSGGFKECGPEGAERERRVLHEAREGGVRLIGPNCLGVMLPHCGLNATSTLTMAQPGSVAFISQSGALCAAVLDWSRRENVGFSALLSVGSMIDVGWGDLIDYFGGDPHTRSIVIYMETIGDVRSFLSAAREVAFTKPIIVVKAGRTAAAASAAASHTGALTGSDAVIHAAFRRVGVLRVETIEELFDLSDVLQKQPRPRGPRLGIVTNAGGPGALAVDRLLAAGGVVASLADETIAALDRALPAYWSRANPVDILDDADDQRFARALELVAADPATDGLLVILTPRPAADPLRVAEALKAFLARNRTKPLLASWMGGPGVDAGVAALNAAGVPVFAFPERAAQAFACMWRYSANIKSLYETPTLLKSARSGADPGRTAGPIIQAARQHRRTLLTSLESKRILAAYDLPVVPAFFAATEHEAVTQAGRLGYPVVIKIESQTIAHKAAAGGVYLNLRDAADVRRAWQEVRTAIAHRLGEEHFQGVTVERMISGDGYELILGSSVDAQFGPVLLFGAGGRAAEALRDQAIGLPPLTSTLARRLMEQTRVYSALQGLRDQPPVDLPALEQVLVRFSQLVAEQRAIREIDVNPLFFSADQIVALDARIILHDPDLTEDQLPAPAIRPYPQHYTSASRLKDGTPVVIRAIRPEDEPLMVSFHETLSDQSVYYRYFTVMSLTQRTRHARLARLCFIDYDREIALVVVHEDPATRQPVVLGVGRLCKRRGGTEAEFAVIVSDRWQRRGVGTLLLGRLIDVGRSERLTRITGTVLAENHSMRRLCERLGFVVRHCPGGQELEASITL